MRNIELTFEHPYLLLAAIPAWALVLWACRWMRRAPRTPLAEKWALALRVAEVALAALILAGAALTHYTAQRQTIVLADRSDSMAQAAGDVDQCLADIAALAGEEKVLGVMDFAAACSSLRSLDQPAAPIDGAATDLEGALRAASAALTGEGSKRILLLTDGLATDGSVEGALSLLEDVRVDAIPFSPPAEGPEVELTGLTLPASAAVGQRIEAEVAALSTLEIQGLLSIYQDDALVHQQQVSLAPGENRFTWSLTAPQEGFHAYRAQLEAPGDTLAQNNEGYGFVQVNQGTAVLLVDGTGSESPKLRDLLAEAGYSVTCVTSGQLPQSTADLCAYGLVVLMNVDARDLPPGSAENLEAYISEYGRSVLTTGGENTYFYGNMAGTAFDDFLPVDVLLEEKASADPIALTLVIDVTDSMTRQSLGVPIEMARRSAVKCVEALNGNDYVGLITFSDQAQVLVDMTSGQNKASVIQAIQDIETVGPQHLTQFTGALRAACDQLKDFDRLERRHVLFITDGSPSDEGFEDIVREMKAEGITLSTVLVGKLNSVMELLQELAAIGGGRCYVIENAYDLPDIVAMDTTLLQVEYTLDQPFTPHLVEGVLPVSPDSQPTLLFGSVRARAKEGARVALAAPDGQPVYVTWAYGTGRCASFLSDLSGNWSNNWFTNAPGQGMILDMVRALLPGGADRAALTARLSPGGAKGVFSVEGDLGQVEEIRAQLLSPAGETQDVVLERAGADLFAQEISLDQPGLYHAALSWQGPSGAQTLKTAVVYPWSQEYKAIGRPQGHEALLELCAGTGGALFSGAEAAMALEPETTAVRFALDLPLTLALALCLTLDLALRKSQWKGLRRSRP